MHPSSSPCRYRTLARSSFAHIQICPECGHLALHLGPLSFRIDRATAEGLWALLGVALRRAHYDLESERAAGSWSPQSVRGSA